MVRSQPTREVLAVKYRLDGCIEVSTICHEHYKKYYPITNNF